MTIQNLGPSQPLAGAVRASSSPEPAPGDRYTPATEGTLPQRLPEAQEKLSVGALFKQAGLDDAQGLVSWLATARPQDTPLVDFAQSLLQGVRSVTSDLKSGVPELIRWAETARRAELQEDPGDCLKDGLEALKLARGVLQGDPQRCSQFRGLLAVLGDPELTFHLLFDPPAGQMAMTPELRDTAINDVIRKIRENHKAGAGVPETDQALKMREQAFTNLVGS